MTDLTLTVQRLIDAPIEALYNAWLDPQMLTRFMTPDDGVTVSKAEVNPVVGGRYLIVMKSPRREMPHTGEYLVLTPHTQIAFTWDSPFSIAGSTVTIDFKATDQGTMVTIHHVRFTGEEMRTNHENGWTEILEIIDTLLSDQHTTT